MSGRTSITTKAMHKLDSRSLKRILSALEELHSDADPATLPERAVSSAMKLVRCDLLTFDFFSRNEHYEDTAWASDPKLLDPNYMRRFGELLHQHPIVKFSLQNPNGDALKITDAVTQNEFERTDLFNEVYRRENVDKQMGCALLSERDLVMTYAFSRKKRDFSDQEKAVATLAAPHFVNAIRNGFAFGRLSSAMESSGAGVIALDSRGKTTFCSSFARTLLEKYFSREAAGGDSLPLTLAAWLRSATEFPRHDEYRQPTEPLRTSSGRDRLTVRLLDNRPASEEILLLEERRAISPGAFRRFGLTPRECEIIYWIAEGKSDPHIAELCSISIRTVQKHIEHIYTKLGVETRTAALALAFNLAK